MFNKLIDDIPGIRSTLVVIGASESVAREIFAEKLDYGGMWAIELHLQAVQGIGNWEGSKQEDTLRVFVIAALDSTIFCAREDSGVTSISDLEGKKFSMGMPGSGAERHCKAVFDALDIHIDPFIGSFSDAVAATKDGRIVGYFKDTAPHSLDPSHIEIMSTAPLTFFGPTEEEVDKITAKYPYIVWGLKEAGHYKQLPELGAVYTKSTPSIQGVGSHIPEEVVYEMTKAIIEGRDTLLEVFPQAGTVDFLDTPAIVASVPGVYLHAGAVRYYREIGVEIPEGAIPPEMK